MRIMLVVPAYRCPKQIERVIGALALARPNLSAIERVVVIDNDSPDQTFEAARAAIETSGCSGWISAMRNPKNLGLGGTQKAAFQMGLKEGFTHVIVFHGDDQGEVSEIANIAAKLKNFDAVLGSRFVEGSRRPGYSKTRVLGNRVLNFVFSIVTGEIVHDLGSGLNGFSLALFPENEFQRFSDGFNFNVDLLLYLIEKKRTIEFVPMTWKEVDQVSNARNFRVAFKMLGSLVRWRFEQAS
jgi:dolichol-phosphate mannosyltransferase